MKSKLIIVDVLMAMPITVDIAIHIDYTLCRGCATVPTSSRIPSSAMAVA
jgi:hypothetical protein